MDSLINIIGTNLLKYILIANLIFILITILIERRNPLYSLFWVLLLIIFPYLGFLIYLYLGISFRKRRLSNKATTFKHTVSRRKISVSGKKNLFKWQNLMTFLEMSAENPPTFNNSLKFYFEGNDFYEELKKELRNAKNTINMEYYIFRFDKIGKEILEILKEKSREGVKINLTIDGVNNDNLKIKKFISDSNIDLNFFFKTLIPFFNIRVNYRNHKKVTVIDSRVAFLGGMNIGDEYTGKSKFGHWRDTSFKILGDAVLDLEEEFFYTLDITKKNYVNYDELIIEEKLLLDENSVEVKNEGALCVQVLSSGPNYEFRTLRDSFIKLIQEAKKSIWIQTPYFVPDDILLDSLKIAILSGIDVKIMIPEKADHILIYWVNQFYAGDLLELGASIYKYDKGFLHSKILIVDDEVVSIGTGNFDYRSFYLNFEININVYEKEISNLLKEQFLKDINDSKKVLLNDFKKRSIFSKILESIFRLLSPIL